MPPLRPLVRPLLVGVAVAALLAAHAWMAHTATTDKSPAYDEPLHLTAGYAYWLHRDFRLQPENGNLPQRWAALPLLADSLTLPVEGLEEAWRVTNAPRLMTQFLYGAKNDTERLVQRARAAALMWSVALGLLVFGWGRRLWGETGGLFALALFAVSPTMLAHGPLVTSDMSAAFFLVAATGAYWLHLQRMDLATLALSAATLGLAAVTKFSVVLLPFVFAALAVWRLLHREPWGVGVVRPTAAVSGVVAKCALLVGSAAVHGLVVWAVIWSFFAWRFEAMGSGLPELVQYFRGWDTVLPPEGWVRAAIETARSRQLLPDAYLHGFAFVHAAAQERPAFLAGAYSNTGWWWFFPYAFAVKSSLGEIASLALAGALAMVAWRRAAPAARRDAARATLVPLLPLAVLVAVYGGFSVASNLNIGHRHLLPVYPAFFIATGCLVSRGAAWWRGLIAAALVALATYESVAVRPHYLAFFNRAAGGPSGGWRLLVDSSLDWGMDLPRLATWLTEHRRAGEPVHVSVFGALDLAHYGIEGRVIAPEFSERPRRWAEWEPGLFAVSATMLWDVYSPFRGPWTARNEEFLRALNPSLTTHLAAGTVVPWILPTDTWGDNLFTLERLRFARLVNYLRRRAPEAVIAHTIFVHRLTDDEVRVVTRGEVSEYLALLDATR